VVYSNLFKKIEKEIKIYEEKFKETLLMSHEADTKKKILTEELLVKRKPSERTGQTSRSQSDCKDIPQIKKFIELDQHNYA
jgi:hypothetical protein